jgi:predicted TIM-barrel fold metal-dependent hydrolase
MAIDGIVGEVLISRFAFGALFCKFEPDVEAAYAQVCNDWLADTFKNHFDRFAPGIHLPTHDPAAATEELARAAGMGLRPAHQPELTAAEPRPPQAQPGPTSWVL